MHVDKKDLYIKEKLQKDKQISKQAEEVFNNFKGGNKIMDNEKKEIKVSLKSVLAVAACFVLGLFVGVSFYANSIGKPNVISAVQALVKNEPVVKEFSISEIENELKEYLKSTESTKHYEIESVTKKAEMEYVARIYDIHDNGDKDLIEVAFDIEDVKGNCAIVNMGNKNIVKTFKAPTPEPTVAPIPNPEEEYPEAYENYNLNWASKGNCYGLSEFTSELGWDSNNIEIKNGKVYSDGKMINNIEGNAMFMVKFGEQRVEALYVFTDDGSVWKSVLEELDKGYKLSSNFERVNINGKIIDMTWGEENNPSTNPPYFLLSTGKLVNEAGESYSATTTAEIVKSFGNVDSKIYVRSDNTVAYYNYSSNEYITIKDENGNDVKFKDGFIQYNLPKEIGELQRIFILDQKGRLLYMYDYQTQVAKELEEAKNKTVKTITENSNGSIYTNLNVEFTDGTKLELKDVYKD